MLSNEELLNRAMYLTEGDTEYVLSHLEIIKRAKITEDSGLDRDLLECLVVEFSKKLAYCRYVCECVNHDEMPCHYDEWMGNS